MNWFKLFNEFAADPKVQTMSEALQRRLVMLYCLCCTEDPAQLTDREIAAYLHISLRGWEKTRAIFIAKQFMETDGSVPNFEARQGPIDPTAAARMRRLREKQRRNVTRNGECDVTRNVRDPVRVTPPRTRKAEGAMGLKGGIKEARAPRNVTPNGPDPTDPIDPAYVEVARYAEDVGGPDWPEFVHRMAGLGHAPDWIRDAIGKCVARGDLRPELVAGILAKYRDQGGPDRKAGEPRRPAPATGGPIALQDIPRPAFIPEGPQGDAVRKLFPEPKE